MGFAYRIIKFLPILLILNLPNDVFAQNNSNSNEIVDLNVAKAKGQDFMLNMGILMGAHTLLIILITIIIMLIIMDRNNYKNEMKMKELKQEIRELKGKLPINNTPNQINNNNANDGGLKKTEGGYTTAPTPCVFSVENENNPNGNQKTGELGAENKGKTGGEDGKKVEKTGVSQDYRTKFTSAETSSYHQPTTNKMTTSEGNEEDVEEESVAEDYPLPARRLLEEDDMDNWPEEIKEFQRIQEEKMRKNGGNKELQVEKTQEDDEWMIVLQKPTQTNKKAPIKAQPKKIEEEANAVKFVEKGPLHITTHRMDLVDFIPKELENGEEEEIETFKKITWGPGVIYDIGKTIDIFEKEKSVMEPSSSIMTASLRIVGKKN